MQLIPRGSVDFILDTTGQAMQFLSLMTPATSLIVSISTTPSGAQLQASNVMRRPDNPRVPWGMRVALDAVDGVRRLRAWRWGVGYEYMFLEANAGDLGEVAGFVDRGGLVPVVGETVELRDVEAVRAACVRVYQGKGGVGKTVVRVVPLGERG